MNVKKVILCLILIIIIIIAAYCNTQIVREGYFDTSMPSLDMIKKVPLAPDANITKILAKMYAIVKDNEDFLTNTYNNMRSYGSLTCDDLSSQDCESILKYSNKSRILLKKCCPMNIVNRSNFLTPNTYKTNMQNIQRLSKYMMKHEQILQIFKGKISYLPSQDLAYIINDDHPGIELVEKDLALMAKLEPKRTGEYVECRIPKLKESIAYWQSVKPTAKNDDQRRNIQTKIDDLNMRIDKLESPEGANSVNCDMNPINEEPYVTSAQIQTQIQMLTLYYLFAALKGQISGINQLKNSIEQDLLQVLPSGISTTAALENQLSDLDNMF